MLIKKSKKIEEKSKQQWIQIAGQKKSSNIIIGNFYQPSSKLQDKLVFLEKFKTLLSQVTLLHEGPIILTGDFNIGLLKEPLEAERLADILHAFQLTQHGTQPTRKSKSLIDHIISTQNLKLLDHDVVYCDEISNYDAPFCIFKASKMMYEPRYKFIRDERRLNIENYITDFQSPR